MKNLLSCVLVASFLAVSPVGAADWRPYGNGKTYDASAIDRDGDLAFVWTRSQAPGLRQSIRYRIDCKNGIAQVQDAIASTPNGASERTLYNHSQRPVFIQAGTPLDEIRTVVCKPWYWPF